MQNTNVVNSRKHKRTSSVWRRRKCKSCGALFTSIEQFDYTTIWLVESGGNTLPFTRDKLFLSIAECLPKTQKGMQTASELTDTVIKSLLKRSRAIYTPSDIVSEAEAVLSRFNASVALKYITTHNNIASSRKLNNKLKQLPFN